MTNVTEFHDTLKNKMRRMQGDLANPVYPEQNKHHRKVKTIGDQLWNDMVDITSVGLFDDMGLKS